MSKRASRVTLSLAALTTQLIAKLSASRIFSILGR
jgi:hypothetical protein